MESGPKARRGFFQNVFISSNESRLRAGWRLLIQMLVMVGIAIGVSILFAIFAFAFSGQTSVLLSQIAELLTFTISIFLARRFLDKRSIVSMGFKLNTQALLDIGAGILITFFIMGFIYVAMSALGWLTFEGFTWQTDSLLSVTTSALGMFVIFILVGWNEELLSRGYQLQTLASGMNLTWGVLISSAVFGLLHLGNPNATWISAAGIFFAGLFLASGYLRTGQLWLSIGLHIGWNFFEGVVFGFPVSGLDIFPLTRITVHGPELWTGGAFGPEAGLIVLPALVLGVGLVVLYTRRRAGRPDIS